MKYNDMTEEYYVTVDDVVKNSTITSDDISQEWQDINDSETLLMELSQEIYSYLYNAVQAGNVEHHARMIRKLINRNERRQYAFMRAVIEYIRTNIDTGQRIIPVYSKQILREAGLYITGQIKEE